MLFKNKTKKKFEKRVDAMASVQVERPFGCQQEKHSLAKEKDLENLEKKEPPPCCCLIQRPCLIHFAVFSNLNLSGSPVYSGPKSSCFTKDQLYTTIYLQ